MQSNGNLYLMESDEEALRLDRKTDPELVRRQAKWAGLTSGLRIADMGCGSGKTSYILNQFVQPGGETIGFDISDQRIRFAREHYVDRNLNFVCRDIRTTLDAYAPFDLIWVRFVLEYYRKHSFEIVSHISNYLKPGGTICLIDLDHNCLNHFGMPPRLESALQAIMQALQENANFDPFVGRKLYAWLYDLDYRDIEVNLTAHHLIYGKPDPNDVFNWKKKVEVAAQNSGYDFDRYPNQYSGFVDDFDTFFNDPRRFTYTPVLACKGRKPT
jgi:SAM-dependent methyltransferase